MHVQYLPVVLRDRLVRPAISRTDLFWRSNIRRTLPIIVIGIVPKHAEKNWRDRSIAGLIFSRRDRGLNFGPRKHYV